MAERQITMWISESSDPRYVDVRYRNEDGEELKEKMTGAQVQTLAATLVRTALRSLAS